MSTATQQSSQVFEGGPSVKRHTWSRALVFALAVGALFMTQGDSLSQVVTATIGIDPLSILDLQVKPNVLVVLDTSGSMRFPPNTAIGGSTADLNLGGDDPVAKMYQAKTALTQVLTQHANDINFGFASYGVTNTGKELVEPSFQDSNGAVGPLTYVSIDAAADAYTGGAGGAASGQGTTTDYFTQHGTGSSYLGTTSALVFNSFRPFNQVYPGPGCAANTNCRYYVFSRILRNNVQFQFDLTAGSAGLQTASGYPKAFTCPLPPVGLFPQDPNVDAFPATTDIPRPCFKVFSTKNGDPGAVFYYTSGTWEVSGSNFCASSALLQGVAGCATNNVAAIQAYLKPEMPVDGSCGDAVGVPCDLTKWLNNTTSSFDGTNPAGASANTQYGIIAAQSTPLAGVLNDARNKFATFFPNYAPGQANYVLLVTDGDDTCANNVNLDPPNAAQANWNANPRIGTFVIGFGLNSAVLNDIAQAGSGGVYSGTTKHWSGGMDAFTAQNLDDLINQMNLALQNASVTGEFSDSQTVTDSVFEYGEIKGVDPRDATQRYSAVVPLLMQSTFEMPGFVGHLNAFLNSAGTSTQAWDAGDKLCQQITGFPMTTTPPARCNVPAGAGGVSATKMGNQSFPFGPNGFTTTAGAWGALAAGSTLTGAAATAPNYIQTSGRLARRIFTTTRNGVFPYNYTNQDIAGASQKPSDGGPTVPLWPPSITKTGVDPDQASSGTYPAGALDGPLGIASMSFATLQTTFGACKKSGTDLLPSDCTSATKQLGLAMKEAREMILAFTAGAQVFRDTAGIPRRDANGNILYQARTWFLADGTLSGPAMSPPPLQRDAGAFGQGEYNLYLNGPKQSNGTPMAAASQVALGYGLRNPDLVSSGQQATFNADTTIKPVMSVVYYGANDMLHAFRAGPQCAVVGATTSCPASYDTGGEELWGFIPFDQLGKLQQIMLQGQSRANHKYVVATAIRLADVFVPASYTDPAGTARAGHWRRLIFFGRGIGGKYYTALDVTSPGVFTQSAATTNAPLVLWNRGNPDTQDGTAAGASNALTNTPRMEAVNLVPTSTKTTDEGVSDATAYATMGQTWSVPAVARVIGTNNFNHDVLLFSGSGYRTGNAGEGRSFYSIDPITGDVLTQADVGSNAASVIPDNAIVAAPAVFNEFQLSNTDATKNLLGVSNPMANPATRVYVGDVDGRLWKFSTNTPGVAVRVHDFGADQPLGNAVGLINYDGGTGTKPHIYVETGNDRRIPPPPTLPPPPNFHLVGLEDNGAQDDTTVDNATVLFDFVLDPRYRGTVQPAATFNAAGNARVFLVGTRFNPLSVTGSCQSSFDSVVFAVAGQTGAAVYDLNGSGTVDSTDLSKTLANTRVNAVSVTGGTVMVDQGLQAQNAPPPPTAPVLTPTTTVPQVALATNTYLSNPGGGTTLTPPPVTGIPTFGGGSTVCR
jgi:hypothetical protein